MHSTLSLSLFPNARADTKSLVVEEGFPVELRYLELGVVLLDAHHGLQVLAVARGQLVKPIPDHAVALLARLAVFTCATNSAVAEQEAF